MTRSLSAAQKSFSVRLLKAMRLRRILDGGSRIESPQRKIQTQGEPNPKHVRQHERTSPPIHTPEENHVYQDRKPQSHDVEKCDIGSMQSEEQV